MAGSINWDAIDPHVREEYQRLRASGHPEGQATLSRASKASLAGDALATAGPEGEAAGAVLKATAGRRAASRPSTRSSPSPSPSGLASRAARSINLGRPLGASAKSVATSIPGDNTLARLILAGFAGVLALEVISQLTGGYFSWDVKSPLKAKGDLAYRPLYRGQEVNPVHSQPLGGYVPNNPQVTHGALPV